MTMVKIMGEPSLLEKSKPVEKFDTELANLIKRLTATMQQKGGVGIAAPQIGINQRVMMFGFDKNDRYPNEQPIPFTVLVNPTYQPLSDEKVHGWEGCLSVPGMRGLVPRYQHIRYQGFDQTGQPIERTAEGFHARVVQHEIDHLDGILFPFRIENLNDFGYEKVLLEKIVTGKI